MIKQIDHRLLFNCDESSDKVTNKYKTKKIIVPKTNNPIPYFPQDPCSTHITLLIAIGTDLTCLRPFVIVTRKTTDDDTDHLGLPDSKIALIRYSKSGYINSDLFLEWLNEIFIPEIRKRRKLIGDQNAKACLLMDNHVSHHSNDAISLLNKNNIIPLFIPPHSSHRTQPLDRLTFFL